MTLNIPRKGNKPSLIDTKKLIYMDINSNNSEKYYKTSHIIVDLYENKDKDENNNI